MSFWDTVKDIGLGVSTGGLYTVGEGLAGKGPLGGTLGGVIGGLSGHADAPAPVYYGGDPNYGAQQAQSFQQQAGATRLQHAPIADYGGANAAGGNLNLGALGVQQGAYNAQNQQALGYLANAAAGKGPSAAQAQYQSAINNGMQQNLAMAAGARGQAGLANAQSQALQQNAQMGQQAATNSAMLRAQEMQAAQAAYAQAAGNAYGQATGANIQGVLGEQGLLGGQALSQAQLQAQQNALNQQGGLGYEQLGMQSQQNALQAGEHAAGLQAGVNENNANNTSNFWGSVIGGVAGATSHGDAKLREPGGGAGWTLREEDNFILARNDRTGEVRKLATQPLTPEEEHAARAPHGADAGYGKMYGDAPGNLDFSDDPALSGALGADASVRTPVGPIRTFNATPVPTAPTAPQQLSPAQKLNQASSIGKLFQRPKAASVALPTSPAMPLGGTLGLGTGGGAY